MFGYHKAKRENKKSKKYAENLKIQQDPWTNDQVMKDQVKADVAEAKTDRQQARGEGKQYAEEVINRDVPGLTPEQKNAMQYEANKQVKRSMQSANRNLLGQQSTHGISPKSGVAYAQQRDIQKQGQAAMGQNQRDLDKLNADLSLKKLAAMFNIEQGEASQAQLDKQLAIDQLRLEEEKRKQRYYEDQANYNFNRV